MSVVLYQDMGPPYVVRARILACADFDPTVVSATRLEVTKPSGATAEWTTTVITQDTTRLLVEYALQVGDLSEVGFWTLFARSDVPGGSRRTKVDGFWVDPPNKRR